MITIAKWWWLAAISKIPVTQ